MDADERFFHSWVELSMVIQNLQLPMVHGTAGEYLLSIMNADLGGMIPGGATVPNKTFLCPADFPSGLLGAYCFALRDAAFDRKKLSGTLTTTLKHSPAYRYVESLNLSGIKGRLARHMLRRIVDKYQQTRGKRVGAPVLLLVEMEGIPVEKTANQTAVDFFVTNPVPANRIAAVLVPDREVQHYQRLLGFPSFHFGDGVGQPIQPIRVLPLEALERESLAFTQKRGPGISL